MAVCFKLPSLAKKPRPPPEFPEFSWKEVRIEAELGCGSFGTRKRKGGSNKPSTERRHVVRSRVLQPSFMPLSNTISSGHAVPETSDQGGKEGRPLVCNRVVQPSFAPVSSCASVPGTYVSDQNTTSWPFISPYSQIQPSHGFIAPETPHLIPNYHCPQRESQQVKENAQPT